MRSSSHDNSISLTFTCVVVWIFFFFPVEREREREREGLWGKRENAQVQGEYVSVKSSHQGCDENCPGRSVSSHWPASVSGR